MTQKELLYVEDAIGHESSIVSICEVTINSLEDESLKSFMKKELKEHQGMKDKLMKLLEDCANE